MRSILCVSKISDQNGWKIPGRIADLSGKLSDRLGERYMERTLLLEDGTRLKGNGFGSMSKSYGEIVFTTSMTGYLESITDPSYAGQILVFASPTIGNYPLRYGKMESDRIQVAGIVARDAHSLLYSGEPGYEFSSLLESQGIPGIDGIDTRMLVRKIRSSGVMRSYIMDDSETQLEWIDPMKSDLVGSTFNEKDIKFIRGSGKKKLLFINLGAKKSLIENMLKFSSIYIASKDSDLESVDDYDAIFISNGPGDPKHPSLSGVTKFISSSIGKKPIFGVCFGLQIIALAYGSDTYKMKFGHRGSNHAVTDGKRIFVTTQNHGYAVNPDTVKDFSVSEWDVNDHTIEMIEDPKSNVMALQYHPESSPGPHDARWFFSEMKRRIEG
ncbi:MAG: glutamine-hydrolyzing carbamoyl-phosphate synthase small subunit [Thermoplasmata archaeon]